MHVYQVKWPIWLEHVAALYLLVILVHILQCQSFPLFISFELWWIHLTDAQEMHKYRIRSLHKASLYHDQQVAPIQTGARGWVQARHNVQSLCSFSMAA